MMRKRHKLEFSKILWAIAFVSTTMLDIFCGIMVWRTLDMSVFAYWIPAKYTELATATGFYFAKAKAENEIKLKKVYGIGAEQV